MLKMVLNSGEYAQADHADADSDEQEHHDFGNGFHAVFSQDSRYERCIAEDDADQNKVCDEGE